MKNGKRFPSSYWAMGKREVSMCSVVIGYILKRILHWKSFHIVKSFWKAAGISQPMGYSASRMILDDKDTFPISQWPLSYFWELPSWPPGIKCYCDTVTLSFRPQLIRQDKLPPHAGTIIFCPWEFWIGIHGHCWVSVFELEL